MVDLNKKLLNKTDFITFMELLHKDFQKNKDDWENWTAGDYIESISAWIKDTDLPLEQDKISFEDLRRIFLSGKFYE